MSAGPAPLPQPVLIYRTNPRTLRFQFWTDTARTVPRNLTTIGTQWRADIRTGPDDADAVASFAIDASAAATGVLTLTLTAAQTTALRRTVGVASPLRYGFDLKATDTGITIVTGDIDVDGAYTQ